MMNIKVLIHSSYEDCLGILEEGVWEVSSCLSEMGGRVILSTESK